MELAAVGPRLESLPIFEAALEQLAGSTASDREALQRELFDRADHLLPTSLFPAMMPRVDRARLDRQLRLAFRAAMSFVRALRTRDGLTALEASLPRPLRARLRSVLETSCFRHALSPQAGEQALYLEAGLDLMMGDGGPVLSEFQLGYQGYACFYALLERGYRQILPGLFAAHRVPEEDFEHRRLRLLEAALRGFERGQTERWVIDAWCAPAHETGTHRALAESLGATWLLFDDLVRRDDRYRRTASSVDRLFIYNQPPASLLDPDDPRFARVTAARFEAYPRLACRGLAADHESGKTFLTTPAVADVLNDKALMTFVPALTAFFTGRTLELPVVSTHELWSTKDPTRPDERVWRWARDHRERSVVTHRYLEGGMGIRVGAAMSKAEWRALLDGPVRATPHHFVLRGYYPRAPACSLRALACGLARGASVRVELSKALTGRLNVNGPVDNVANGGHLFLCFSSGNAPFRRRFDEAVQRRAQRPEATGPFTLPL